jgi:DNA polymerase I-like protein with 3'-5' exonuclease and polymerase domains
MEIQFINIEDREEFELFLSFLRKAKIVVFDTETNGLRYYRGHYIISMSFFFPEFGYAFNIAFRHGEGIIEVEYTDKNHAGLEFQEMTWQGKTKNALYLRHWWGKVKSSIDFGNQPIEWLDEIKALWGKQGVRYVAHNARFDLHMLHQEGFPTPEVVEDTMLALHVVNEDWNGIEVEAPYKEDGKWVRKADGSFATKPQSGKRALKWQAMLWELPNAWVGEDELYDAKLEFEEALTALIMDNLDDPYNEGLLFKDVRIKKDGWQAKWGEKQVKRIRKKVVINEKSQMWMLPSSKVANYAMLDTVLTWMLREKLVPIIERWHNWALYENLNAIQLEVAWRMEVNGLYLDVTEAKRQIALYEPRLRELEDKANTLAEALSEMLGTHETTCSVCQGLGKYDKHELDEAGEDVVTATDVPCEACGMTGKRTELILQPTVQLGSPTQLLPFIRAAVKIRFDDIHDIVPEWVEGEVVAQLDNEAFAIARGQLESTAKEALQPFATHPAVWLVLEYRKLSKTVETYLRNWINARDADGYVHAGMNVDGTVSGRFSSSGDMGNGQNIPERSYTIKMAFIARPDTIKIAIDYGQLEARIAAYIAEILLPSEGAYRVEPKMTELFNSGADMHIFTRDEINIKGVVFPNMTDVEIALKVGKDITGMSPEAITKYVNVKVCRQMAKTLNFGLLYNGSYRMVMKLLRVGEAEAKALEMRWKSLFPAFGKANNYYWELGQTWRLTPDGQSRGMYVSQPMTNRHRKFHLYPTVKQYLDEDTGMYRTYNPRKDEAKKGFNNVVQGWGGWMSVNAALLFGRKHGWDGMYAYAQIHDALDLDVSLGSLWKVPLLIDEMISYDINPRLTADMEAGHNWQPYDENANPMGMRKVTNIQAWVLSGGVDGYDD